MTEDESPRLLPEQIADRIAAFNANVAVAYLRTRLALGEQEVTLELWDDFALAIARELGDDTSM